jgi:hypothetical protein
MFRNEGKINAHRIFVGRSGMGLEDNLKVNIKEVS